MTSSTPRSSIRSTSGVNSAADPGRGDLGLESALVLALEALHLRVLAVVGLDERRVGEALLGDAR